MSPLEELISRLPEKARILDYGCYEWPTYNISKTLGRGDLKQHGCDLKAYSEIPDDAEFHLIDLATSNILDCPDDYFDLIVASHVIEHIEKPTMFFEALLRKCKAGGLIYFEAPSDRSAIVKSDAEYKSHSFLSFWDDPTHIRPWTPAAFYRLALSYDCHLRQSKYMSSLKDKILYPFKWLYAKITKDGYLLTDATWAAKGWLCYAIIEKPLSFKGAPEYKYISLKKKNLP